jgi:vWA-MoxR associated protein C-terminal domain/Domain of unknown function (DUF4145)
MPNPFADLVARLDRLPGHLGEIVEGIRLAIRVAAIDPEMSLTRTRKVLELIVYDVFEKSVGEPHGGRPLENLFDRLKKDKHLPRRVATYAQAVKDLGNSATHSTGEQFTREDVAQSIAQLLIVVDWYDTWSGPDRTDEPSTSSTSAPTPPATTSRPNIGAESYLPGLRTVLDDVAVSVDTLLRLYRECAPPGWEPPPPSHEPQLILWRCAESLARAPRQGATGLFPLLRYARGLRDWVDDETAVALDGWLDASLAEISADPSEATRLRAFLDPSSPTRDSKASDCYLLIQVTPRLYEEAKYGVKAWLFGTGNPACLRAGEDGMTFDQLRLCIDELRQELFQYVPEPNRTRVELLLPRELLCVEVDQWRVELDFLGPIPLGVEHRLVVRSLERARKPKLAMALLARGKALARKLEDRCRIGEGPDGEARWVDEDQCGGLSLYTTLRDAQSVVIAALGAAPHPCPRDPKADVLFTLFEAGLPVVLWSRRPAAAGTSTTRAELLELLGHEPFGRLPDRVWELRKQAIQSGDDGHIGRHLTLLWDDPARTSPDFEAGHRLRAPTRE